MTNLRKERIKLGLSMSECARRADVPIQIMFVHMDHQPGNSASETLLGNILNSLVINQQSGKQKQIAKSKHLMTWVDNKDFKHQRDIQNERNSMGKFRNVCINKDIECDFESCSFPDYGSLTARLNGEIFATAYKTVGMGEWSVHFNTWKQKGKTYSRHCYVYGNVNSAKKAINQVANLTEFFMEAEFITSKKQNVNLMKGIK